MWSDSRENRAHEWEDLIDGEPRIFGFLQVDIPGSRNLKGSARDLQRTKENLGHFVFNILDCYKAKKLIWAGDGGAYIFLIKDSDTDYDKMVLAALNVLSDLPFFNKVPLLNLLDQELSLRISCHRGEVNYHRDPGKMHSEHLNYFLKYERDIGHENAVTITEDLFNELVSKSLKGFFQPLEHHTFMLGDNHYTKKLYLAKWEQEFPRDDPFMQAAIRIRKKSAVNGAMGKTLLTFAKHGLIKLEESIEGLSSEKGVDMNRADVTSLTQFCFEFGGKYDGTDRHTPSEFLRVYPEYLNFHQENLKKNPGKENQGCRILITTMDRLRGDSDQNPNEYHDFLKWHEDNQIPLHEMDPLVAEYLKNKFGIWSTDIGIWYNRYALLFEPRNEKGAKMWLVYAGDTMYENCIRYFKALSAESKPISKLELFDKKLALNWEGFISPEKRLKLEGPFLIRILDPYKKGRILDGAAGLGCEYAFLSQNDFNVLANEIEGELREMGKHYTFKKGVPWMTVQYEWEAFGRAFPAPYWDVILILGNSLCLLLDRKRVEICLEQFFRALKPGGMLVVDERNFPYIFANKENILKDPLRNFRYRGEVMYCQSHIRGVPYVITEKQVTFIYFSMEIENIKEAFEKRVGHLHMYPFEKDELLNNLKQAGFENIRRYSDFEEGYSDTADFFTYTAVRPQEK